MNVKQEVFGGYDTDGGYVVRKTLVRCKMAKGEVRPYEQGCERDVFTFCLYHGVIQRSKDGNGTNSEASTYGKDGVSIAGWKAARQKAATMIKECAALSARAKAAKLRKCMRGC